MATAAMDLGEKGTELERGREEGRCGGDGVFQLNAELAVVVVEAEAHRRGLLSTGEVGGDGKIFSARRRIFSFPRTRSSSMRVLDAELDASASPRAPMKSVLGKATSMAPAGFPR